MKPTVTFSGITTPPIDWQARALAAEAKCAQLEAASHNSARLVSLVRDGRAIRFVFTRKGSYLTVETYALMSTDIKLVQQQLLGA